MHHKPVSPRQARARRVVAGAVLVGSLIGAATPAFGATQTPQRCNPLNPTACWYSDSRLKQDIQPV
jgi:hypothetical protein